MNPRIPGSKPRLILVATGVVSVALALWHFVTRAELIGDAATRAAYDLNGLSMLFAGCVTVAIAWKAVSIPLITAYGALYGFYYASRGFILFFAGISWQQAGIDLLLAIAAWFAASNAWAERSRTPGS